MFAVLIPVFAYANVGLAINDEVPAGLLGYGLGLGLLAGVGHLVVRKFAPYADPLLLLMATPLNGLQGWCAILAASDQSNCSRASTRPATRHPPAVYTRWASRCSSPCSSSSRTTASCSATPLHLHWSVALFLLLLPLVPRPRQDIYGAQIWIQVGSFSIQPGEFAKIVLAIFFAGYLMVKRDALALASRRFMGLYLRRAAATSAPSWWSGSSRS